MQNSLEVRLESLLFASPGPVTIDQLATALEVGPAAVKSALSNLEAQYADRGLRIQYHQGRAQMTSAPEYAPEIERLLQLDSQAHLSRAALEVLAIVTYRQPITRPEIDSIRGVNSDSSIKTLHRYGLIEEIGRTSGPGRPILYGTSGEFLQHFGISSLDQLPEIKGESPPQAGGSSLPKESGEQSDESSAQRSDSSGESDSRDTDPSEQAEDGS